MKKVYIVSKGGYNYSAAEEHGEIIYLSDTIIDKYNTTKLQELFEDKLKDSTKDDKLIITGLPIMCAVASSIIAAKHGIVNYLLFSNGVYVEKSVEYN